MKNILNDSTQNKFLIIIVLVVSIIGFLVGATYVNFLLSTPEARIAKFYDIESEVSVSPSTFIRDLQNGNQTALVVDLRTVAQYNELHLVTAVNIPATQMTSKELVAAFRELPKDKPIVTYCYSSYCTLSTSVGKTLSDNGIYVKHLTAGWYELQRDYSDFLVSGSEPGVLSSELMNNSTECAVDAFGEFSC